MIEMTLSSRHILTTHIICCFGFSNSANTGHSPNAVSMLAHRLQRWPNIETPLGECPVSAGRADRVTSVAILGKPPEMVS